MRWASRCNDRHGPALYLRWPDASRTMEKRQLLPACEKRPCGTSRCRANKADASVRVRSRTRRGGNAVHPRGQSEEHGRRSDTSAGELGRVSLNPQARRERRAGRCSCYIPCKEWRPDRESNPGARICSPLRHHSAIGPERALVVAFCAAVNREIVRSGQMRCLAAVAERDRTGNDG
jgi:hypothetical protein